MKRNIIYIVCGILCVYLIACWIDVVAHNNKDYDYAKWNMFNLLFGKEEKVVTEEPTTAEYTTEEVTTEEVTTEVTTVAKRTVTTEEITITEYTTEATTEEITTTEAPTTETVVATGTDASIDDYELWLLAHLINGEAGATWCSDTTRYYVGSVVLNRVNHAEFPDSIEGVIYQSGQYSCTWDGNFDLEPSDRCWEIARDLLINGSWLPNDVVFQANFSQGSGVYDCIDGVYFCYR